MRHFKQQHLILLILLTLLAPSDMQAQTYEPYIEQRRHAASQQQYNEAIPHFRQALRLSPDNIRNALTYANIARIQDTMGEPLKPGDTYDSALRIAPENSPMLQSQADLLLRLGNYPK